MTSKPVYIHPAALEETEAAAGWYAERSRRAADGFLAALDRIIQQISSEPWRFPEFAFGTRRAVLSKFPYVVIFRETVTRVRGRRRGPWPPQTGLLA